MESVIAEGERGLSIGDFKRMVLSMGAKELASIPIERLPDTIPDEVLEMAPYASKHIIEDFIFELNTREIHLQMELAEYFPADVIDALNLSRNHSPFPCYDLFKARVSELLLLYKRWEKTRDFKERKWLTPKIKEIDKIVPGFRLESKAITRSYLILEDSLNIAREYQNKFEIGIQRLKHREKLIEVALGRYFLLRLAVIGNEMLSLEVRIRDADVLSGRIKKKIDCNHERLLALKSPGIFARNDAFNKMLDELKDDSSCLMEEMRAVEVMISETDLIGWLDVIVDASISSHRTSNNEAALRKVRGSLYRLLNKYCECQEQGALQIAQNPFLQCDPKQSIRFMLRSEQFILDYFANKKSQMLAWIGGAAETKINKLFDVEKELLKELKRNARFKKK